MSMQSKGKCKYCGKEYTRGYINRHLASCKERAKRLEMEISGRRCGYFELGIYGKYEGNYWLLIEVKDTATLEDIDSFLRDIWLECCGHLSAFQIDGCSYEYEPESFWGKEVKSMDCSLKKVLRKGMVINYEYDFGSTTELLIKVHDHRLGYDKKEKLEILSRNNSKVYTCGICGKRSAAYIDVFRICYGNPFLCEKCSELPSLEEEYLLRVCNSPRMGVCGYEGSSKYPDQFIPDMNG